MFAHKSSSLFACLLGVVCVVYAEVYQPPSPEPTDNEVAILELMNRFRTDPVGEADRILQSKDLPSYFWRGVDKAMFEREVKALKPTPPLVFDLNASLSARHHSHYMIINNAQGHVQDPSKPGYTGKSPSDRMKYAGFRGASVGENAYLTPRNPWLSHAGFIVDFGPGAPVECSQAEATVKTCIVSAVTWLVLVPFPMAIRSR